MSKGHNLQDPFLNALRKERIPVSIFLDQSSIEVFLNGGQKVMTAQFFNTNQYNQLKIENKGTEKAVFKGLKITPIHSIWGQD